MVKKMKMASDAMLTRDINVDFMTTKIFRHKKCVASAAGVTAVVISTINMNFHWVGIIMAMCI